MESTVLLDVNGIRVRGLASKPSGVEKYLGIPFARVTQRFRPAQRVPLATLGPELNATAFGPRCPQAWNYGPQRRKHLYEGAPSSWNDQTSETNCLSVNVYVPPRTTVDVSDLPVLVWIHGGGWVFGDGGAEYDGTLLIKEASRLGKPFVVVTMNYRLGYYGFLSSRELQMEAEASNERYCPNLGLLDQRMALEWVQENISHFGGDPKNCTIAGQSAGAWSVLSHLVTDQPLCKRGLVMSATVISFSTTEESQEIFDTLVERAGVSRGASAQEKLAALRGLSDDQMTAWLDGAVLIRPSWDPSWFSSLEHLSRLDQIVSFPDWVEGIVIGSTKDETANIRAGWQPFPTETIVNTIKSVVPRQDMTAEIIEAYGLTSSSHEEVLDGLISLTTESFFGLFPQALAPRSTPVSVYRFEQTDTFEQSFYRDKAYHCLDLPFLWRSPAVSGASADAWMRSTADALTDTIARFVNGQQPWECFQTTHTVMVFNGKNSGVTKWPNSERWKRFLPSPDRSMVLVDTGRRLMTYNLAQLSRGQPTK